MLKLFPLIMPYRGYVALVLVLALAQSIAFLLLPRLMSDIVDQGIVKGDQRAILQTGGLMLVMSVVATLCAIAGSYFSAKVATGFGRILRGAIFARVSHFSIHQFDRFSAASLVTRTTNDTTQVQQMLIMMLTMVITAPMMAIGGIVLALSQDTQLAWVLIAVMPVMALVFGLIMRGAVPLSQAMQLKIDRLNLVLGEGRVDTRTEVLIQRAMVELMRGRTTFVIAHRLSTVRNANVILMMEHGQILEKGTHHELLAANGRYAELYRSQFAGRAARPVAV